MHVCPVCLANVHTLDTRCRVDIAVAHRVAFDTLLPLRAATLRSIAVGRKLKGLDTSRSTLWRALRDLEELGMIVGGDDVSHVLADGFRRMWLAAKIDPASVPPR
jgi:hypothetical protein